MTGATLSGERVRVDLGCPGTKALLFLTSSCHGCMPVWSGLRDMSGLGGVSGPSPRRRVLAVVPDPATESSDALRSLAADWLEVVMSSSAWLEFSPGPAPWLITTDGTRITYSGPAPSSPRKLRRLLRP